MPGFGEQRQGVGANSGHYQQHDIGERYSQRDLEHSLGTTPSVGMHVHIFKCTGDGDWLQPWSRNLKWTP